MTEMEDTGYQRHVQPPHFTPHLIAIGNSRPARRAYFLPWDLTGREQF